MPASNVGTIGNLSSWQNPDDWDWSGEDEGGFWPVSRLRDGYLSYLTAKIQEYEEARLSRHLYHGSQWNPDEIRALRARRQPVITYNRTGRKIDQIVGLVQRIRQDPKAFPRNPKNADGAEIATLCIQSVLDAAEWEFVDAYCAGQAAIEGIAGVELKLVEGDHADPDLGMDFIFGDDFFYDPRSYKPDFSDARYLGISKWLDVEAAVELFPDKETELRTLMVETGFDLTTHADREYKWIYVNEKRLRLVEMWYRSRGRWFWSFFCSMLMLDQGESPFKDERNKPMPRFVMWSANVDHDGDRYGFVRNLKGPQDELNHRRSKALHMSNVTRLIAQKGAVDDVEKARKEYARPDGFVEFNPGFEPPKPDDKSADLAQQLALMQDARTEIDSFANVTPDLVTRDIPGDHSGVAINLLQKAGVAELGSYLRNYKNWKKRVYKAIWNIVQRTWQQERWIRVTDNQGLAQFIQVNGLGVDQLGRPTIVNALGNLNVEITMDEGPDEANMMQDAYDVLKQYPPGAIPPAVLIELSPLSSKMKQRVLQLLQTPPNPMQVQAAQLELQQKAANVADKQAQAHQRRASAVKDVASAAHLAHDAHMREGEFVRDGFMQVNDQMAAQPEQPQQAQNGQQPPPPPGQPMAVPQMAMPPQTPSGPSIRIPANHPVLAHARRSPKDGQMYVPDANRPGKYMRVA